MLLTGCASTPRVAPASASPDELERSALRYELRVLTAGAVDTEPVEVDAEALREALRELAREVRASERPRETARWLDVADPRTGYKYELLTRTHSNMQRHGRRMAEDLFRMIGY